VSLKGDNMKAAALSLAGYKFASPREYLAGLAENLTAGDIRLVVLPAYLALFLAYRCGELGNPASFPEALSLFFKLPRSWHDNFREMHACLAARLSAYLVSGTDFEPGEQGVWHTACLFSPRGELMGVQEQLFLSRQDKKWGLTRGNEAPVFETELGNLGLVVGTDAWYPEVGRILSLKGANILCHCGALPAAGENRWRQLAGMWQQVQQTQVFCVESQLVAEIAGTRFAAESVIHAPCEMTDGLTGVSGRGGLDGKPVTAVLDEAARQQVAEGYPLRSLLNPAAYSGPGEGECGGEA
jgi:predicted amidohydrolase